MAKKSDLLNDITKLAGSLADSAVHSVVDAKKHISELSRNKIDDLIASHNLVKREEFEILKKMIQKSVLNQEKLDKRLSLIEKKAKNKKLSKNKQ